MNRGLFVFLLTLCCHSSFLYAAPSTSTDDRVNALTQKETQLEAELKELHDQVAKLQQKKTMPMRQQAPKPVPLPPALSETAASYEQPVDATESDLLKISPEVLSRIHQTAINYTRGITVTTSPILGLKSAWNPFDLLYLVPSMNQDLRLLQDRDSFEKVLESMGSTLNTRPMLVFSGALESTLSYINTYTNTHNLDVNLTTAEIDLWAVISTWASGFITVDFDSSPPQTGARVTNSRLYVKRAFFTIGDLAASPFYMTMGQLYVPFGRYASAMVTTPVTISLARVEARAVVLGYFRDGLYSEIYGFKGNRTSGGDRLVFQGGFNIGYENSDLSIGSLDIGTGYITNIADAQGQQDNGLFPGLGFPATQFGGLGDTVNVNGFTGDNLKHNVPGANIHMEFSRGILALFTEFSGAVTSFNAGDMMYNNHGASPKAMHLEMDLNFKIGKRPLTIGGAYDQTWDALPLNLPAQSFFALISTSLWKDTVQSLEYRHDINYGAIPNTSVGGAGNGNIVNNIPVTSVNVGGTQDLISLLFGVYF